MATLKECARRVWEETSHVYGTWFVVWKTGRAANTWNVTWFTPLSVDNCYSGNYTPGDYYASGVPHNFSLPSYEHSATFFSDVLANDPFAVVFNGYSLFGFDHVDNVDSLERVFRRRHSRRAYQLQGCTFRVEDDFDPTEPVDPYVGFPVSPVRLEEAARDTAQQVNPETVTAEEAEEATPEDEADKEMPWEGLSKEDYYALADTGPSVHPCDECKHDFDPDDLFCMACRWNPENRLVGKNAGSAAPIRPPAEAKNRHNDEKAAPIVGYNVAVQDMLGDLVNVHHTAFPLEAARVARLYADACMKQAQAVFVFPVRDSLSVGVGVTGPPGIQRFPLSEWEAADTS